jgi:hypothetical protein
MRFRAVLVGAALVMGVLVIAGGSSPAEAEKPGPPSAGTICTWGGTAAAPTGTFTITPGLTATTPLTTPARFYVTGDLGGGCQGTLTYVGQIDAGGTCSFTTFEGKARGIPTVTNFVGVGVGPFGPARLYDRDGHVIASENANVVTTDNNASDCATPDGFEGGNFSSTIVFVDEQ